VALIKRREPDSSDDSLEPKPEPAQISVQPDPARDPAVASVLDTLPIPVWLRRRGSLEVSYCNAVCRNILLDAPEDGADNRMDGHDPPEHPLFNHAILARRALDTGREQTESRTLTIDGKRRLFDISERPFRTDKADVNGCTIGFAIDQSVLVALQDDLGAHVAANDAVLDMMTAAIAIFGPDRRLRFHNDAFRRIWGLEAADLDREPMLGAILDLLRDRRQLPEVVDFPAFKKDWNARFTNLIDPVEDLWFLPDERAVRLVANPHPRGGLIFTFEDVTDRLALERSYNTATAVQRATLNNLLEAVAVFGSDGRLKLHNRIYREIWGFEEALLASNPHVSELIDRMQDLQPSIENWPIFRADLLRKITAPSPDSGRLTVGDGRVLDYALVPLPDGDCLAVYVDVTDAAKLQQALEDRNQALERADLIKSRFVASMSYEFRTPLNAIIGFSELLRSQAFGPLNDRQSGYIDNLISASMILAELINDTLDLAAIQADTFAVDLTELEVAPFIEEIGKKTRDYWQGEVQVVAAIDGPARIAGDSTRLRRAFDNIIANTAKFAAENSRVTIAATASEKYAVISITDETSLLPADDREQIIQTLNTASQDTGDGTIGLRLALSRSLIELHGGTIDAQVPENGGLRITCRLPLLT